jgi:hypothetical protein
MFESQRFVIFSINVSVSIVRKYDFVSSQNSEIKPRPVSNPVRRYKIYRGSTTIGIVEWKKSQCKMSSFLSNVRENFVSMFFAKALEFRHKISYMGFVKAKNIRTD